MATKKGIIDKTMESKPVAAAKGLVDSAVNAFMDPPLAPADVVPRKSMRGAAKKAPAKKAPAKKAPAKNVVSKKAVAKKMDRKLVSTMEDYEVKYLAQKHKVTQKAVKAAVAKVGNSRNKVEAELKRS